jgi:hypothetical protein
MEAGRRTGPRRRVAVPAPEEKQGLRGEPDDGVAADRVACPAGGDLRDQDEARFRDLLWCLLAPPEG